MSCPINLTVAHRVLCLTRPPPDNPSGPPIIKRDDYFIRLPEAESAANTVYNIIKHLYKWDLPSKKKHLEKRLAKVHKDKGDKETNQNKGENNQKYEARMQWIRDTPYRKANSQARWLNCAIIMDRALEFLEQAHQKHGDISGKSGDYTYHYHPRDFYKYIWAYLHQGNFILARKESELKHGVVSLPNGPKHGLASLPNESKFEIAEFMSQHDLAAFAQTSRHFSDLAIRELYRQDSKSDRPMALIWAAATGKRSVAEKALKAGTDVNLRFDIRKDDRLLSEHSIINWKDKIGWTPLFYAVDSGSEALVRLLLKSRAHVNLVDNEANGRTPLSLTAERGSESVVELLLEAKAKTNSKTKKGKTPLMLATIHNSEAVVRLLLKTKAKVNSKDRHGRTALWHAVRAKREAVIRLLLKSRAQMNWKDHRGDTPLSIAAKNRSESIVRLLLKAKAKVNVKNSDGRTPLWYAVFCKSKAMVQLFLETGAKMELALSLVAKPEYKEFSKLLLAAKKAKNWKSTVRKKLSLR
ncbi:uncharacterized protein PgNI_02723 [Pyricularia grisea]|uniref:F-box domain-containing protein n=1 Tax=Pyricularia grisea TaxID=148305 RepID=A0A6P8B8Y0_PYRGI|nr:uncharacterized protein PgNI_02723 [Pyricularia grisea]TLD12300.1 hypothetical protein PgNI_02723 [Pyricularia grisea]